MRQSLFWNRWSQRFGFPDRYRHHNVPDTSEKSRGVNAVCQFETWNNRAYPTLRFICAKFFDNVGRGCAIRITHTEITHSPRRRAAILSSAVMLKHRAKAIDTRKATFRAEVSHNILRLTLAPDRPSDAATMVAPLCVSLKIFLFPVERLTKIFLATKRGNCA